MVEKPFGYLCIPNRKAIDGCRIIFGGILFGFISSPEHDICNPAGPQHISLYLVFRSIGQYFIIQFRFFFKVFDFRVIIRIVEVDFQTIERYIIQVGFNAFYIDFRNILPLEYISFSPHFFSCSYIIQKVFSFSIVERRGERQVFGEPERTADLIIIDLFRSQFRIGDLRSYPHPS